MSSLPWSVYASGRDTFSWRLTHPCGDDFFGRIGSRRIDRTNKGDDFPEVVRGLDGETHRRHWCVHTSIGYAVEARFFQLRGAQRHEPEQHVISVAPEPNALRQGRAHTAAAAAAVTLVAPRQPEHLDELLLLRQL